MKIPIQINRSEQGSSLMVTMILCSVLFITIVGYLLCAQHQQYIGHRAQVWNMAMPIAEAGIEEALQHLNINSPNLEKLGWTRNGNSYSRTQVISDKARYVVTIDALNINNPTITSVGYHNTADVTYSGQAGLLATAGVDVNGEIAGPSGNHTINRSIRVTATRDAGLFIGALIARDGIDMAGNGVRTDSFISTDPRFSNGGLYPAGDLTKLRSNGDVYVNSSIFGAASVGNAEIYGHLVVGPDGVPNLGPNGAVGTYAWRQAGNTGIQPGHFRDDSNYTFPDLDFPYTFGATPTPATITTTNISIGSTTVNSSTYPSPVPVTGVVTNISYVTTSVEPVPAPPGMIVNIITTRTSSSTYPAPGTYLGEVSKNGSTYRYDTAVTNYNVTTEYFDYVLKGGDPDLPAVNYYLDNVDGKVYVTGNARLVTKDGFDGEIFVNSDGKFEMYAGGTSINLSGNGVINNNGNAANCKIWCLSSVKEIAISGNGEISVMLYAPYADLLLNGGGKNIIDFVGSVVVNSAYLNGHFSFHYDEALRSHKDHARYLVTSWNEI